MLTCQLIVIKFEDCMKKFSFSSIELKTLLQVILDLDRISGDLVRLLAPICQCFCIQGEVQGLKNFLGGVSISRVELVSIYLSLYASFNLIQFICLHSVLAQLAFLVEHELILDKIYHFQYESPFPLTQNHSPNMS